jgi:hypothetical protein
LPAVPSCWICRPCPGYHWKTTGSSPNVRRVSGLPMPPVHGCTFGRGPRRDGGP